MAAREEPSNGVFIRPAPVVYRPVVGEFREFQALDGHGNIVLGDVVRRRLGVVVDNIRRQPRGEKAPEVGAVVGICTKA